MELWIARDKDGSLYLFTAKPIRCNDIFSLDGRLSTNCCAFAFEAFPEVTWENSPKKVTIELAEVVHWHLGTELSKCECVQLNAPANPILSRGIFECGLSVRAMHCLESADIHTVGDLVKWKRSDLLKLRNFGLHTIREIEDFLIDNDLTFGMKVEEAHP